MPQLPQHILEKILQARERKLNSLDLSAAWNAKKEDKLTEIPADIFDLTHLTWLDLSGNGLTILPETLGNLTHLTTLNLSGNGLTILPETLGNLTNLRELYLGRNGLTVVPETLRNLTKLTTLNLSSNQLTVVPEWIVNLTNLTWLDLSGNGLTILPETLSSLTNLTWLALSDNQLTVVPEWIVNLTNLTRLDLNRNGLAVVPRTLGNLMNLSELNLSGNGLTVVPRTLGNLTKLTTLNLSGNQLTVVPETLGNLTKLTTLNLSGNPITKPPLEVVENGLAAIREYYRQVRDGGYDYLYEAKLLIVGEAGAGKTTLAKKIQNTNYDLNEAKTTLGIEVGRWEFPMEEGREFRVNIWDFGGQEIYHATHQFFLTKRSLYIIVADNRKEDTNFYYWLNVVELLSDSSPVFIVKNEKEDRSRAINEGQLRGQFNNLERIEATNFATNRGLPQLLGLIKYYISHLHHIGSPLPKTWVRVREALEADARNYISLAEYLELCQQNGFTNREDKLQLSDYLHCLGVCLHFQKDLLLNKTIILKPKWGTEAVYKVLDNPRVLANLGRFTQTDLVDIWREAEFADMRAELLQLMVNFKLCYKIANSDFYIAPQLLTPEKPAYDWNEEDNLFLTYDYEFMPKGIVTQFIVATHGFIADQRLVWRTGVILAKEGAKAEVIENYDIRRITVRVAGRNRKELLTIIGDRFETIHTTYNRLKYDTLIPCNCPKCKSSQSPNFYKYDVLRRYVNDRQPYIECQNSYQPVDVLSLIDDVMDRKKMLEPGEEQTFGALVKDMPGVFITHVGSVVIQQTSTGTNVMRQTTEGNSIMPQQTEKTPPVRSAWANGSFYLFAFAVVIAGLGVLARSVPAYALLAVLCAAIVFVPLIGALQLKQDARLTEKGFLELMRLTIAQLPLIGKLGGAGKSSETNLALPTPSQPAKQLPKKKTE